MSRKRDWTQELTDDELAMFRLARWAIATNDVLALRWLASRHIPLRARLAAEAARTRAGNGSSATEEVVDQD